MGGFPVRILFGLILAAAYLTTPHAANADLYKVKPGDSLEVTVLEDPNLNRVVLVRPDGRITLPIAGTIQAEGLAPEGVQRVVRRRLASSFEISPTVTVSLVGTSEDEEDDEDEELATVYIFGEVRAPGAFETEAPISILQALSLAGGLDRFAAPSRIQIRRVTNGTEEVMPFDFDVIEDGGAGGMMQIIDGDVIFVPERGLFE